jgi:hypothetical protein
MMISGFSARTAILQAYSMDMATGSLDGAGAGYRVTSTHRLANCYEAAKIISAVEALPVDLRAWAIWAYGPAMMAVQRSCQEGAVRAVVAVVDMPDLLLDVAPAKALRVQLLAYAHMDNHRALAITGAFKYRKPAHFDQAMRRISGGAVGLELQGRNYQRDYGWLADCVGNACAALDEVSLQPVGAALRSVREFRGEVAA